ncbi:MAG: hypothetical protein A3C22_02895 [Candidatus Levybacteria bacterium RIFCSPHIGHO2_02_FULL_37_10]|nr:MAG: hypothetical protein A3C22_02895 [Candidatus Levybacteria bacterium RIFCSPHIGHO2_02_FULL_37_10]OGH41472.1 MAG: hypothetical protein A3H79_02225 [Candidatus Levybacteria bacterium RIFCSPLOWO2_02_FULL_36_8b]
MGERFKPTVIETGLWKGIDVAVARSITIKQYEKVPIILTRENVPSFTPSNYYQQWFMRNFVMEESGIYVSVRSRYAQIGLDIGDKAVGEIKQWLYNNSHLGEEGNFPNKIMPVITVENHGFRPVALGEGTRLFRFIKENFKSYLEDDKLVQAVKSGLIKIQGDRLGDWTYSYGEVAGHKLPRPTGIFIRINTENRRWIPPHPDNEPICIPDSGEGYRKIIDSLLKPIPEEKIRKILWIGETIKVTLDPSIDAILDTAAIRGIKTDKDILDENTWGVQLNSRVIDGGRTDWQIRTEIISQTSLDRIPNFAHLRFIKKPR